MPIRAENINAFNLKLLKSLINFKINKNYARDLTTDDKRQLCKTYNSKEGIVTINHDYLIRIWPKSNEISSEVSLATLNQLCGILRKDYRWFIFKNDVTKFCPEGIPDNKAYSLLDKNQTEKIDKAITEIFFRYKTFEEFSNEVIDKIEKPVANPVKSEQVIAFAHRVYIELSTRKAAIHIDEDNDVIEEIYDSWYKLFCVIREEMKLLPVPYLVNNSKPPHIIGLTFEILNKTLRSHLTQHQAKFRKWLQQVKTKRINQNISPQALQKKYPDYKNLIVSIQQVNDKLINYSKELFDFIEEV